MTRSETDAVAKSSTGDRRTESSNGRRAERNRAQAGVESSGAGPEVHTKAGDGKKRAEGAISAEAALARRMAEAEARYLLRLYVAGFTARSTTAISNLKAICEEHLKGRYQLDVVDIYQQPTLARQAQITAAPTLIRRLPKPLRQIVGDMSRKDRVLIGLDLLPQG